MLRDAHGLPVSTDSRAAVAHDAAVAGLPGFAADTVDRFRLALEHDPGFALARAALAVALYLDEQIPEGAMAANPRDAWAVHAMARVHDERGDNARGIAVLPPVIHPCNHLGLDGRPNPGHQWSPPAPAASGRPAR